MAYSTFAFYGIKEAKNILILSPPSKKDHRIQFIGDSDTAGYCIDGHRGLPVWYIYPHIWKYESCAQTYASLLSNHFNADQEIIAISSIGVYQNVDARLPIIAGKNPLPAYYNRTLLSVDGDYWNYE